MCFALMDHRETLCDPVIGVKNLGTAAAPQDGIILVLSGATILDGTRI